MDEVESLVCPLCNSSGSAKALFDWIWDYGLGWFCSPVSASVLRLEVFEVDGVIVDHCGG